MFIEWNVKVGVGESLSKKLKEKGLPEKFIILKKSLDARKKPTFIYRLVFEVDERTGKRLLETGEFKEFHFKEEFEIPTVDKLLRVAVVGSGPAGLFAAYVLAIAGCEVLVYEKGKKVEERIEDVQRFWIDRVLDENSNVQFGEGGAGTFSDGKLVSRVKDKRKQFVYETFVRHGAPDDILYLSKPHIGTDKLQKILPSFRKELENKGVTFYFSHLFKGFERKGESVNSIFVEDLKSGAVLEEKVDALIIAIGNSARDTFYTLEELGVNLAPKPFAVGVRIIHPQKLINRMQYGKYFESPDLPPADYSITANVKGRGVFSFCMCPGGVVICASSERETVVTNGMSNYAREGVMANSAIVVQVFPEDFKNSWKSAVNFQKELERAAFVAGGENYAMPAQNLMDFLKRKETPFRKLPKHGFIPEITSSRVDRLFPPFIYNSLKGAFRYWEKRLKRFVSEDATVVGVETRTSSPFRILRDERLRALGFSNLYPAGEGAGYAGGITSSALDGIKVALSIVEGSVS